MSNDYCDTPCFSCRGRGIEEYWEYETCKQCWGMGFNPSVRPSDPKYKCRACGGSGKDPVAKIKRKTCQYCGGSGKNC